MIQKANQLITVFEIYNTVKTDLLSDFNNDYFDVFIVDERCIYITLKQRVEYVSQQLFLGF